MENSCFLCNQPLYDIDSLEFLRGAYLMPCCNTVTHRNCIVEHVRNEVGLGNTPECPNEQCRKEIKESDLPSRKFSILKATRSLVQFLATGCFPTS